MSTKYRAGSLPALARLQHGVFSREQVLAAGIARTTIDARVSSGTWERLYAGVYRIEGTPATWRQSLLAACLAWGDGACISHRAAGALRDLPELPKAAPELIVPRDRRRAHGHLVHRPRALASVDAEVVDAIPVTTAARTLIDLATCVEADVLEEALDDALRRRLVTVARLRWRMREVGARTTLKRLVDARATAVPESVLETRLLRVLRKAGLPAPVVQHQVGRYRVDFAYPGVRVAIEADGFAWHSSRRQLDRDSVRRNVLAVQGWTVLHFTWEQLHERPDEVVDAVRAALTGRESMGSSTAP